MRPKKILIVGVDSALGSRLAKVLAARGHKIIGTSHRGLNSEHIYLDLLDDPSSWVLPNNIDVACLFAGVTNIRDCEDLATSTSRAVNVEATIKLSERLFSDGAFLFFPSSNHVFDGHEIEIPPDTPQNPVLEYGRHKMEVENFLLRKPEQVAILRLSKVLHDDFPLFNRWLYDLKAGKPIYPFEDLWMAPVSEDMMTKSISLICEQQLSGLFQLSGNREVSYYEAGLLLSKYIQVKPDLVIPSLGIDCGVLPTTLRRHSTLESSTLLKHLEREREEPEEVLNKVFEFVSSFANTNISLKLATNDN